jgi:tubulysin polyketide synthase-like protein
MTILDTIPYLESLGVKIRVVGNRLDINAPKGVLTPGLLNRLRREKGALIEALRRGVDTPAAENLRIRDVEAARVSTPRSSDCVVPHQGPVPQEPAGDAWAGVDTQNAENRRICDLQTAGVSTPAHDNGEVDHCRAPQQGQIQRVDTKTQSGVDTRDPENRRIRDLQTAGVSTPQKNRDVKKQGGFREAHSSTAVQGGLWSGVDTPAPENDRIRDLRPGSVSTPSTSTSHGIRPDPMARAFRAAGLSSEMPADPDQARDRLHRLLEHVAPRPDGVPAGCDLVILFGGHHPGPKLLCSYEPWPDDPAAHPLRWRPTGSEAWRALGLDERTNG